MHVRPGADIAQTLTEAYRSTGKREASVTPESAQLAEVVRIIGIYSDNMRVEAVEVISTADLGLVLTSETALEGVKLRPGPSDVASMRLLPKGCFAQAGSGSQ